MAATVQPTSRITKAATENMLPGKEGSNLEQIPGELHNTLLPWAVIHRALWDVFLSTEAL
jgi:hypothetical protein